MDYTFEFDVIISKPEVIYTSIEFTLMLNEDEANRVKASFDTGKYLYMDEDSDISDIYDIVYEEAMLIADEEDDAEGIEHIRYPKEFRK